MLGDLALLHDQNGLVIGPEEAVPDLCLVVVDNDGGGIFGSLEQAHEAFADVYERVFGTPVATDVRQLLVDHGVRIHEDPDLQVALTAAASAGGLNAVVVGPISREEEAVLHRRIRQAVQ